VGSSTDRSKNANRDAFAATFATLKGILQRHGKNLVVLVDQPGDFQVGSPTMVDRLGRPLFVAAAQIKASYVSFHLMPIYTDPALLKSVSPALRARMQGKSCFNFTTIDTAQAKELTTLTKAGIARFKNLDLPWGGAQRALR
jgi:hypothetical protein